VSENDITTVKYDAAGNQLWATSYSHTTDSTDYGLAVAVDVSGNVYTAGQSRGGGDYYYDMILIKYDGVGNRLWVARYNGPGNQNDRPNGLAVDGSGNVLVALESGADIVTLKYDGAGNLLWTARYSGSGNAVDVPRTLVVDAADNAYVTGYCNGPGTSADMVTIKYGPNGDQLWDAVYNGPSNENDTANNLVLDAAGNVYVVGESQGGDITFYDFVTVKYNSAGTQIWASRYDGTDHLLDEANFVAVDGSGNVYVSGNSYFREGDRGGPEIATLKIDAAGNPVWVARYHAAGAVSNAVSGLALDSAGNVYVAGWSFPEGDNDSESITLKYDPAGTLLWENTWAGLINNLAVDPSGNAVVSGGLADDFALIKYDAAGNRIWTAVYDSSIAIDDRGRHIALDEAGNIYIAGDSGLDSWSTEMVVAKYSAEGSLLWSAGVPAGTGGVADMRLDVAGNVFLAGTADGDIVVIKYDNAGNRLWTGTYSGPDDANDGATALAVDSQGNAYVTGWSTVYLGSDIVTLKYDAAGNRLWMARTTGGYAQPGAIAVARDGQVIVTGHIEGGGINSAFTTLKYDAAGNPVWVAHYSGYGMASALALDDDGNVHITGWIDHYPNRYNITTAKYDANGNQLWVSGYNGPVNGNDFGYAIAVDSFGNVYVAGRSNYYGGDSDMITLKYDRSGTPLWAAEHSVGGYDAAAAMVLDDSGNVYVTGYGDGGGTGAEYATLKYDTRGSLLWAASYNGTGSGDDTATALALDGSGNVFVTGASVGPGTGADFVTIKYRQAAGPGSDGGAEDRSSGAGGGCFINTVFK
jgi:uncharacterized delta-60 repeat protein